MIKFSQILRLVLTLGMTVLSAREAVFSIVNQEESEFRQGNFFPEVIEYVVFAGLIDYGKETEEPIYSSSRYTIAFNLQYRTESRNWSLRIPPRYQYVKMRIYQNRQLILDSVYFHNVPFFEAVKNPLKTQSLFLERGSDYQILLEFPGHTLIHNSLFVMPTIEMDKQASQVWYISHSFLGFVLATLIVNFILMTVFRLRVFLWCWVYLAAQALMGLFFLQADRFYFNQFFTEGLLWVDVFMMLTLFSFLRFTSHYFSWEKRRPSWVKYRDSICWFFIGAIFLRIFEIDLVLPLFTESTLVIGLFALFMVSIQEWRNHFLHANYFVVSMACYFVGIFIVIINEIIPLFEVSIVGRILPALIGTVLQMIVLTFILSQRVLNQIRSMQLKAEKQLTIRENLMRNVSHELRTPLVGLIGIGEQLPELTNLSQKILPKVQYEILRLKWTLSFLLIHSTKSKEKNKKVISNIDFENIFHALLKEHKDFYQYLHSGPSEIPIQLNHEEIPDVFLLILIEIFSKTNESILEWLWECDQKEWSLILKGKSDKSPFNEMTETFHSGIFWLHEVFADCGEYWEKGEWRLEFRQKVNWNIEIKDVSKIPIKNQIMVVDDNFLNRKILNRLLRRLGFQVISFESGLECIEYYQLHADLVDLIFMDIQMPEMDGFETTAEVRILENSLGLRPTPIWAVTALESADIYQKAKSIGMQGLISKPFEIKKLNDLLKGVKE